MSVHDSEQQALIGSRLAKKIEARPVDNQDKKDIEESTKYTLNYFYSDNYKD